MAWLRFAGLVAVAGCGFSASTGVPGEAGDGGLGDGDDAPVELDAAIDAPASFQCYGTFAVVCLEPPNAALTVNAPLAIDTDTSPMCRPTAGASTVAACVIAGTSVTINAGVVATGSKPLVIVATSGIITLNQAGSIDVASRATVRGAGSLASCIGSTPSTGNSGGHGGTFIGRGGRGGTGNGGAGGEAPGNVAAPMMLRGGCPGINGSGSVAASVGVGGRGGGAVSLIASAITISSLINASGAGGLGGKTNDSGGGGGGSGGMIVLDAMDVTVNASGRLIAQGGGGGEGSSGSGPGANGSDPSLAGLSAPGGFGFAFNGGNGGAGSTSGDGGNGDDDNTGGGGGGGTGYIEQRDANPTNSGVVSPPFS